MTGPVIEKKHNTADDFINYLLYEYEGTDGLEGANGMPFIYRGERTAGPEYKLLPSILRDNNKILHPPDYIDSRDKWLTEVNGFGYVWNEFRILYNFYISANKNGITLPEIPIFNENELNSNNGKSFSQLDVWIPDELLEIAGIAQHYGVPTRLLDWTLNPFTALYFAAMGAVDKYYNDIIKNKNSNTDISDPFYYNKDDILVIWAFRISDINLLNQEHADINVKLIRPPYSRNPNLAAQKGLFTHEQQKLPKTPNDFPEVDKTPLDQKIKPISSNRPILYKHLIPVNESNRVLRLLITLHHSASNIFPGLTGVAREVTDQKKRVFIRDFWRL